LLLPPPKALPIASVRAAVRYAGRGSMTAPMLGVDTKSNGMSDFGTIRNDGFLIARTLKPSLIHRHQKSDGTVAMLALLTDTS
jgi:hypothetical protein